jgi:hypothetical protein
MKKIHALVVLFITSITTLLLVISSCTKKETKINGPLTTSN